MITMVMLVDGKFPEKDKISQITDVLRSGGIAAIPTETVFGLACNRDNENAVKRIYEIKKRPTEKSLVIQIADIGQLSVYKAHITPEIKKILKRFWPGPLTAILNTKYGKTGFRIPDNKTALSIIRRSDFPFAVTSANISGENSMFSAEDILAVFSGLIEIIVDDKTKIAGVASTVIDCTQTPFKILRDGILAEEIKRIQMGAA